MELTGFSSDFICDSTTFPQAMRKFVRLQLARWPRVILNEETVNAGELSDWALPETRGERYPDVLAFCRDRAMDAFWDKNGYAIEPASGEGSFAVYYRVVGNPVYARGLQEARETPPQDEPRSEFEGTRVLLAEYVSATLLTPDDPRGDPFSRSVLHDFLSCLGGRELADVVLS